MSVFSGPRPIGLAPRYYGSVRSILWIRFDPGTIDRYDSDEVRVEVAPQFATQAVSKGEKVYQTSYMPSRAAILRQQSIASAKNAVSSSNVIPKEIIDAIRATNINLSSAVASLSTDGLTRFFDVVPTRSSRKINSFRIPDELELTLDWRSLPFDSRLIRAAYVLHYEGTVPSEQWATGQAERNPIAPRATGYKIPLTGSNFRYMGTIDEFSDDHDDAGDTVTLKSRDMTALLIDQKLPRFLPDTEENRKKKLPVGVKLIKPGQTIVQVIRALLDTNPGFDLIRGPYARVSGELPTLDPKRYPRIAVPPKERHTGTRQPFILRNSSKAGDESYWDAITDLCVSHALVPMMDRNALVLVEPRTLYKYTPEVLDVPGLPRFPTPNGHRVEIGDKSPVRRMVYGNNILKLRFFRKLARIKAPAVQVTAYNPDAKRAKDRLLSVIHPPNLLAPGSSRRSFRFGDSGNNFDDLVSPDPVPAQATRVSPSGRDKSVEVHNVIISGVVDVQQLRKIAEQVYESMGRNEFGVNITTNELASFSSNIRFDPNEEPDLLDLRAGDPIQVLVQSENATGGLFTTAELNRMARRIRTEVSGNDAIEATANATNFLVEQGFTESLAAQLVRVLSTANLPDEFRVMAASVDFDGSDDGASGFSITIDARDYMRVRSDPEVVTEFQLALRDPDAPLPRII